MQPRDHQRRGGEAVLLRTEQRGDHDVATGLELTVGLHDDPVAQPVEQQGLLGLGQAELPGSARVLERGERRSAGATVVTRDEYDVRVRLGHTGGNRADPDLGDQLHVDAGRRVGVLQVVDQLSQILDRVDVVVRRRRDQAHAGRAVPGLGHPGVDLVAGQLATLAGLGALGHLDLDVVGVGEVLRGDSEAAGRDLLDRRATLGVVETVGVLATLTGVGLARPAGSWRSPASRAPPWRWSRRTSRRWRTASRSPRPARPPRSGSACGRTRRRP